MNILYPARAFRCWLCDRPDTKRAERIIPVGDLEVPVEECTDLVNCREEQGRRIRERAFR